MLGQHLSRLQAAAQQLAEAQQLGQPSATAKATLQQDLAAYAWAIRTRSLLLASAGQGIDQQVVVDNTELHIRLSVIETALASRLGKLPAPQDKPTGQSPASQALLQRLATAESRMFHLFGIFPLN